MFTWSVYGDEKAFLYIHRCCLEQQMVRSLWWTAMVACLLMSCFMSQMVLSACPGTALTFWWKTVLKVIQIQMKMLQVKVQVTFKFLSHLHWAINFYNTCYVWLSSCIFSKCLFVKARNVKPLLTVSFISGDISLMNNYDDLSPHVIRSGLKGKTIMALPMKFIIALCLIYSMFKHANLLWKTIIGFLSYRQI